MEKIYKKDDCIIKDTTFTYQVGQSLEFGNCLTINLIGTATEDSLICPGEQDAFSFDVKLPENILEIGQENLIIYIEEAINKFLVND